MVTVFLYSLGAALRPLDYRAAGCPNNAGAGPLVTFDASGTRETPDRPLAPLVQDLSPPPCISPAGVV
jgi:hypothetical protein